LVFLRPDADLDETLAPFDEQGEEFMEFVDKTDEVKAEYDKLPDSCPSEGTYTEELDLTDEVNKIWDEAPDELDEEQEKSFWKPYCKKDYPTPADIARNKEYEVIPDETKRDGVRFVRKIERKWQYEGSKEKYPTLDKFAKDYYGYRKVNGRYGYMSNPNAKWDWYQEGGRWGGYIFNKEGKTTDIELLTEVDWDKMFSKDEDGWNHIPFCFVDAEGVWRERGEMGWFAMVANEKPKADWETEFKDYVKDLLTDAEASEIEVYAIDYHI
jgi:hypothetical protein